MHNAHLLGQVKCSYLTPAEIGAPQLVRELLELGPALATGTGALATGTGA